MSALTAAERSRPRLVDGIMNGSIHKRRSVAQGQHTAHCKALAAGLIVLSLTHNSRYLGKQMLGDDVALAANHVTEQLLSTEDGRSGTAEYVSSKAHLRNLGSRLPSSWRSAERLLEEVRQLGRRDLGRYLANNAQRRTMVVAHLQEHWRHTDNVAFAYYTSPDGKQQQQHLHHHHSLNEESSEDGLPASFLPPLSPLHSSSVKDEGVQLAWKELWETPSIKEPTSDEIRVARSGRTNSSSSGGGASPFSTAGSASPLPMDLLNVTEENLFDQHVMNGIMEFEDPEAAETRLRSQDEAGLEPEAYALRLNNDDFTPIIQNIFHEAAVPPQDMLSLATMNQRLSSLISLEEQPQEQAPVLDELQTTDVDAVLDVEYDFLDAIINDDACAEANNFLNLLNSSLTQEQFHQLGSVEEEVAAAEHNEQEDGQAQQALQPEMVNYDAKHLMLELGEDAASVVEMTTKAKPSKFRQKTNSSGAGDHWLQDRPSHEVSRKLGAAAVPRHLQLDSDDDSVDSSSYDDSEDSDEEQQDGSWYRQQKLQHRKYADAASSEQYRRLQSAADLAEQELAQRRTQREMVCLRRAGFNKLHPEQLARCSQDEFNQLVSHRPLSVSQADLLRDVRRRGRNKLAASRCRQRKAHRLAGAESQLGREQRRNQELRAAIETRSQQLRGLKADYQHLYRLAFRRMRWADGRVVDPRHYRLQLLSDGRVLVVRRE